MATTKDVVQELVEQTKSGKLKWATRILDGKVASWKCSHSDCVFHLYEDSRTLLVSTSGQAVNVAEGTEVQELLAVVGEKFKGDIVTKEEALKYALECLRE